MACFLSLFRPWGSALATNRPSLVRSTVRRYRLQVEELERRIVPTYLWTGEVSDDWNTVRNWKPTRLDTVERVPTRTDSVEIGAPVQFANNPIIPAGASGSVRYVRILAGGSLRVQGSLYVTIGVGLEEGLTVLGSLRVDSGGLVESSDGLVSLGLDGKLTLGGEIESDVTNLGEIYVTSAQAQIDGNLQNHGRLLLPSPDNRLSVFFDYEQAAVGELGISVAVVGGTASSAKLSVGGKATLKEGSLLDVAGFVMDGVNMNTRFEVMTYASHVGTFTRKESWAIGGRTFWPNYEANNGKALQLYQKQMGARPNAHDDYVALTGTVDILGNDSDPDGDPVSFVEITRFPAVGSLTNDNGVLTYDRPDGFTQVDQADYKISDGRGGFDIATISYLSSSATNSPPVGEDDSYTVKEGQFLDVFGPGVLENDYDYEFDPLTVRVALEPEHGFVTLDPGRLPYFWIPA